MYIHHYIIIHSIFTALNDYLFLLPFLQISGNYSSLNSLQKRRKKVVTQSCSILCDPMDYSPPGSCVHRILQASILPSLSVKPGSPALQANSLPSETSEKPNSLHSFGFPKYHMVGKICNFFHIGSLHSTVHICFLCLYFCLIVHFIFMQNIFPLSECTMFYLSIYLPNNILITFRFRQL